MVLLRILVLLSVSINMHANPKNIAQLFSNNNISGSILIESIDGKKRYQYNVNNDESFVPASTFKIANTLIILEEGLISDLSQVIKWDGDVRGYSPWNKDQTLKTAFQLSCVWCYQYYARQVGNEKYLSYLRKFNYGNGLTGVNVARFWLDGELRVSLLDQIDFLRKVHTEELPVQNKHIQTLKTIMLSEQKDHYKIWSKTGWSGQDGWYVGYLVTDDNTWFFANHIEVNKDADLAFRKKLAIKTFRMLNLIH